MGKRYKWAVWCVKRPGPSHIEWLSNRAACGGICNRKYLQHRHWCWFPWIEVAGSPENGPDGLGMVTAQGRTFPRKEAWEAPASRIRRRSRAPKGEWQEVDRSVGREPGGCLVPPGKEGDPYFQGSMGFHGSASSTPPSPLPSTSAYFRLHFGTRFC